MTNPVMLKYPHYVILVVSVIPFYYKKAKFCRWLKLQAILRFLRNYYHKCQC